MSNPQVDAEVIVSALASRIAQLETEKAVLIAQLKAAEEAKHDGRGEA